MPELVILPCMNQSCKNRKFFIYRATDGANINFTMICTECGLIHKDIKMR